MEKRPRKKKVLDVNIDTKYVDVNIKRDASGEVDVTIDTPIVDAQFHKDVNGKKTLTFHDNDEYTFESNGASPHLPKGTIWVVTGEIIKNLIQKGLGKHIK